MARNLYEFQGRADKRLSPFCWRTCMALWHKGLEAEFIPVQFGQKDKISFSGQKLVPVLEDNGQVICDSWTIADYLEGAYPDKPSLFGGEAGRAGARCHRHGPWAMDRSTTPSSLRGGSLRNSLNPRDDCSSICCRTTARGVSPLKGTALASIWYRPISRSMARSTT